MVKVAWIIQMGSIALKGPYRKEQEYERQKRAVKMDTEVK